MSSSGSRRINGKRKIEVVVPEHANLPTVSEEVRPEAAAITATTVSARARFCIVCNCVKRDGPRHKHETQHANRASTESEKSELQPSRRAVAQAERESVFRLSLGKHKGKTIDEVKA